MNIKPNSRFVQTKKNCFSSLAVAFLLSAQGIAAENPVPPGYIPVPGGPSGPEPLGCFSVSRAPAGICFNRSPIRAPGFNWGDDKQINTPKWGGQAIAELQFNFKKQVGQTSPLGEQFYLDWTRAPGFAFNTNITLSPDEPMLLVLDSGTKPLEIINPYGKDNQTRGRLVVDFGSDYPNEKTFVLDLSKTDSASEFSLSGDLIVRAGAVSYTHLTLPTTVGPCRSRWSPYH